MNDLIRPALYQAYHHILPVREGGERLFGDVVGPEQMGEHRRRGLSIGEGVVWTLE